MHGGGQGAPAVGKARIVERIQLTIRAQRPILPGQQPQLQIILRRAVEKRAGIKRRGECRDKRAPIFKCGALHAVRVWLGAFKRITQQMEQRFAHSVRHRRGVNCDALPKREEHFRKAACAV